MPYIKPGDRPSIDNFIDKLMICNEGELNYAITRMIANYISSYGKKYATLNAVHGVLSCINNELYRTVTGPYEDIKIHDNGGIFEHDIPIL